MSDKFSIAQSKLDFGDKFPYNNKKSIDWAERACKGVLADLTDRKGIRQELQQLDEGIR